MNSVPHFALIVAGIFFGFIALIHLLRLIFRTQVTVANKTIPIWVSIIGFIVTFILCIGMFIASTSTAYALSGDQMTLKILSTAFENESSIPSKYTCTGKDISPPLSWKDEPPNTKSFVLIVDDPDAPVGNWDHWIVFNLPNSTHELTENFTTLPSHALYGKNSWGKSAYGGPCPPSGEHRYYFKLYALDTVLNLPAGASKSQIESAMKGHILAEAKLMGRYKK